MKKLLSLLLSSLLLVVLAPDVARSQPGALNTHTLYDAVFRIDTVDLRPMGTILEKMLNSPQNAKSLARIRDSIDSAVKRLTKDTATLKEIFHKIDRNKDSVYLELNNYLESLSLGIGFFNNIVDRSDTFIRYADVNEFLLIRSKIMEAELHLLGSINAYEIEGKEDRNRTLIVEGDSVRNKQYVVVKSGLDSIELLLRRTSAPDSPKPLPPDKQKLQQRDSLKESYVVSFQLSRVYEVSGLCLFRQGWAIGAGVLYYNEKNNADHDGSLGKSSWGATLSGGWRKENWLLLPGIATPDFQRYTWQMRLLYFKRDLGLGLCYSPLLGAGIQFSYWLPKTKRGKKGLL